MRSFTARAWPFALAAVVLGGWRAALWAQSGRTPRPVIAPAPETPGAVARGAADIATAQKLAQAGKVAEAVPLFEKVAFAQPSVVHDCYLSLAYLRAGRLTEAQLMLDVSQLRGAKAPDWCGPKLAAQLAVALRDQRLVPVGVQVTPVGATVEIVELGLRFRELSFVWLPSATYTVVARQSGWGDDTRKILVAPPSASVALALKDLSTPAPPVDAAPAIDPPVPVDAGVDEAPVDAAPLEVPVVPPAPARSRWPAYVGAGVGVGAVAVGAIFHARALDTTERADALTAGSAAFDDERSTFGTQRALALGGYAVGAAAIGFAAYWWFTGPESSSDERSVGPSVGVTLGGDGATVTFGGPLP